MPNLATQTLLKPRICFIDDDARYEIPLFQRVFGKRFDIVCGTTLGECLTEMKHRPGWKPDLFVLDLYFPAGKVSASAVHALVRSSGLKTRHDRGDILRAYQNFNAAKDRLDKVLSVRRQTSRGGIQLAKRVHSRFPRVPIVFYSRKATAEDALMCMQLPGVVDIITKPTGNTPNRTRELTFRKATNIAQRFVSTAREGLLGSNGHFREMKEAYEQVSSARFFRERLTQH